MKNTLFFLVIVLLMSCCSVQKEPIFMKVDNLKILSFESDTIKLKADAFFENPNDVGGKITTEDIKVFVNGAEVAQVFSDEFKVPARNEFSIPLIAHIPTKNFLNSNKNGALGGLLNSLITNKVNVQIKGNLEYVVFGFKREFLIDKTQEIKIKF
ncbi:LEA type 2 family protein [Polaribacter sp. IC073]|nr:LEA type 2 family protein [Polaribacter sp. IC073]